MNAAPVPADSVDAIAPPDVPARWLPRLGAAFAGVAVAEVLGILGIAAGGDPRYAVGADLATVGFIASIVLFSVVGALVIQRRPRLRVAWLMVLIGLGFGLGLLSYGYGTIGAPPGPALPGALELLVLAQLFFVPIPGPAIAILVLLFPTDRLPSERWRPVIVLSVIGAILYAVGTVLRPGPIDTTNFPAIENPFAAPAAWAGGLEWLATIGNTLVTGSIGVGAASLALRYRRAGPVEAAQIRWIALVAGLAAPALAIAALQLDSGPIVDISDIAFGIGLVLVALLPLAIGIAITRYRLYDIDRLINRALVYGSLTAILAGVFTAAIGLAQRVFVATTGQTSDAAIVGTTLVVATLYAPLRKRLEALVDRRFKYEERRFGAYGNEVRELLSVLEPTRAAKRLASEAVAELRATGGAVLDTDGAATAAAGLWPVPPVVRLPIRSGDRRIAEVIVGARTDGSAHYPRAVAELEELVALIATAIRLQTAGTDD
jgi:hypothetical protein